MQAMGYIRYGLNLVNWRNLSDGGFSGDAQSQGMGGNRGGDSAGADVLKKRVEVWEWDTRVDRDTGPTLAKTEREMRARDKEANRQAGGRGKKRHFGGILVGEDVIVA